MQDRQNVMAAKSSDLRPGSQVSYQYRQHYLLGGALVSGLGAIIGRTIVGNQDAYAIKPRDSSAVVHVRTSGVRGLS